MTIDRRERTSVGSPAPLLLIFGLAWPFVTRAADTPAVNIDDPWRLCAREIDLAEQTQRIPDRLLGAIGLGTLF